MLIAGEAIFAFLALVVIGSALGMLFSRNAIYSALFLVLNFATVALLYATLGAPFIAFSQVTVYAGAIMVLFLFVIMLLGAERLPGAGRRKGQRTLAILLALVFLVEAGVVVIWRGGNLLPLYVLSPEFSSPEAIGTALFNQYLLPFEVTSIILLAALIGAVVLTKSDRARGSDMLSRKED